MHVSPKHSVPHGGSAPPVVRAIMGAVVGAGTGLILLIPAGLVALVSFLQGRQVLEPADAAVIGTPWVFVTGYALSFAAGGVVYGLLWPFRRSRLSAALVGIPSMVPVFLGLGMLVRKDWMLVLSPLAWAVAVAAALVGGPIVGIQLRSLE